MISVIGWPKLSRPAAPVWQSTESTRCQWLNLVRPSSRLLACHKHSHFPAMVCKLYSLQFLQAPDMVAVQRLSLVLSILGGRVFFKEPDFKRQLAARLLILGGVFVVALPQREDWRPFFRR